MFNDCELCAEEGWDNCLCFEDPDPQTYKELKQEADRRRRKSERQKDNEFKSKLKSININRVKGGGRDG